MSALARSAALRIRSVGPTRIGSISCSLVASTTPSSETSSHGCATATLMVACACAVLINRWYFSCTRPPGRSLRSGMGRLRLTSRLAPGVKECLHARKATLCFAGERLTRRQDPMQAVEDGFPLRHVGTKKPRQGVDGALLVEADKKVLFPDGLLNLGQ